jgi:hypothetical protein
MKYFILATLFAFTNCKQKDTCNTNLGKTFENIKLDTFYHDSQNNLRVILGIKAIDALPEDYFEAYKLIKRRYDLYGNPNNNDFESVKVETIKKSKMTFLINTNALLERNKEDTISIYLKFPNRSAYLKCKSISSNYYLDIKLPITY